MAGALVMRAGCLVRMAFLPARHERSLELEVVLCLRTTIFVALGAAVLAVSGCQSYAPKPPDLSGQHQAWLERHPSSDEVKRFVQMLRERGGEGRAIAEPGEGAMTIDQAEVVALVFNADLRLARLKAGIAQASADWAGLWEDPVLGVDLERMLSSGAHPWMAMTTVGFTLPISGRLEVEKRRAAAAHHAALHAVYEQEWQLRMAIGRAWAAWSMAALRHELMLDYLEALEGIVAIVTRMEEVGELAPVHGRRFYIEEAQRRNQLRELELEIAQRELALRQLLGLNPAAEIALVPHVEIELPRDVDDPFVRIAQRHPRLQMLLAEYETSERQLELAVRGQYPDLTIGPGHNYEEGSHRLVLGVSLPLPIFNRNQQAIAVAKAERDHGMVVIQAAYEGLMMAYAVTAAQLEAIDERHGYVASVIVPLVDQQYEEALSIAELGEVDTQLILDALRQRFETKLQLLDLEAERADLIVQMRELLGPPMDDRLSVWAGRAGHDPEERMP